jgi:hypothetical protein
MSKAIEKVISIAKGEVGYLEKVSNYNLDSFTGNAGYNNYTKYWRDIYPDYQGQPWCACFVTWIFVKAFGKDIAKKLLKHYPYVYCPTMQGLFTLNANPKVGDIVIFKYGNQFTHTGLVISVDGDYFETIEGNTSSGNKIIANGGGVCQKGYYNSNLPGTKFCTPNYSLVDNNNSSNNTTVNINKISTHLRDWQAAYNATYGTSILVDGEDGTQTQTALSKALIKVGSKNALVGWVQCRLGCKIDNEYGNLTKQAVINFQKKYGLDADGIVGKNTFKKLLEIYYW